MTNATSIFNRVLGQHEETQAAEALKLRQRADAVASARAAFVSSFREAAATVARPIFLEFVADATAHGFAARVEENLDDAARPSIALYVNPRKGRNGEHASEQCSFELAALVAISEVEHISHFDIRANDRGHRINPDGTKRGAFGVSSLHRDIVEREVEEFWKLGLASRKPE
jgi:hypothetical protein